MSDRTRCFRLLVTLGLPFLVAAAAAGGELPAVGTVLWDWTGHGGSSANYAVGNLTNGALTEYRDGFVFDLSGVVGEIASAELWLYNPGLAADGHDGYSSPDSNETLTLFDVSTEIPTLLAIGYEMTEIFDDLGSGTVYGSQEVSAADNGGLIVVELNDDAIADLEASSGQIAIGGALTSIEDDDLQALFLWSHVAAYAALILEEEIFVDGFETEDWSNWSNP